MAKAKNMMIKEMVSNETTVQLQSLDIGESDQTILDGKKTKPAIKQVQCTSLDISDHVRW